MVDGLSRRQFIAVGAGAVVLKAGTSVGSKNAAAAVTAGKVMKTIGVLGGLGPQATMDFEARVHRVAQRLSRRSYNGGYPPMVVYYFRQPPSS